MWELIKFSETGHSALKPVTSSGGSFKTLRIVYFWVVVWKSSSGELSGVIAVQSSRRQLPSRSVACAVESLVCAPSWKLCDRGVSLCRRDREVWQLRGSPNPSKWVTVIVFCLPVARTRSPGWPWYWAHDRPFGPPWHWCQKLVILAREIFDDHDDRSRVTAVKTAKSRVHQTVATGL